MPPKIELPPKYYLFHFQEFCSVIVEKYGPFLEDRHVNFLKTYHSLTEDARCLFLRILNRKGRYFFKDKLIYPEVTSLEGALAELRHCQFLEELKAKDWESLLEFLPKKYLLLLCREKEIVCKSSWPLSRMRQELLNSGYYSASFLGDIVIQGCHEELSYLFFLYFGKIQENLSLYTLRDLGIRPVNQQKRSYEARFSSKDEALSHYFYCRFQDRAEDLPLVESWPLPRNHESTDLREKLLIQLSDRLKKEEQMTEALEVLANCKTHPGREKYVRLLHERGERQRCKEVIEEILENPTSDLEYLFAEDFFERKFGTRKRSILTETLKSARQIPIDESFFRQPEAGVCAFLKEQGIQSFHVENYLWNALFGLLFWEELFENEKALLANEFDRLPRDLVEKTFLTRHETDIRRKLELLNDKAKVLTSLFNKLEAKKSVPNGMFGPSENLYALIELLVIHSESGSLMKVLTHMGEDYHLRSTGFPDLIALEDRRIKFYEIKAPGDSLKQHQLLQMIALQKAGYEVEVLQVEYTFNPNQLYVVVDLETTGGHLPYHRITEVGAVKVRAGEVIGKFQTLVNPERHISREIEALTGISNEMVKAAPKFSEVADQFEEFTKECIFVAHNVAFDYGFIQSEFQRLDRKFVRPYICTKAGMKKHYPGLESYGLKNLTMQFNIPLVNHHRALSDAEAAAELLFLINKKREGVI